MLDGRREHRKTGRADILLLALLYVLAILTPVGLATIAPPASAGTIGLVICTPEGLRHLPAEDGSDGAGHTAGHACCLTQCCSGLAGPGGETAVPAPAGPWLHGTSLPWSDHMATGPAEALFFEARGPPLARS